MISVITAAKGRYDITFDCFKSIWENASNPNNIEHIVMSDDDDKEMNALLKKYDEFCYSNKYTFKHILAAYDSKISYQYRSMHKHYWNPMALDANGDIIFGLCNDTIILTKNYDKIMEDAVKENSEEYGHNFFQIFIDDDWPTEEKYKQLGQDYCSLIILTKPCLSIFDGIAPDELSSQGADMYVAKVFNSTDIKSIIDLQHLIKIKQICVQKGNYDKEKDFVQAEKPMPDNKRPEWKHFHDLLYSKIYYYHKLNNKILQKVFLRKK